MQSYKTNFLFYKRGKMFRFEDIGDKGMRLLLFLYLAKRGRVTDFIYVIKLGKATIYKSLGAARLYGLIREERIGAEKYYYLTEKGEKVAKLILQIEEELGDGIDELKEKIRLMERS